MGLGAPELLIILILVLVLFGGAKLPKLARSLGEAQREFKKGTDQVDARGELPGGPAGGSADPSTTVGEQPPPRPPA